MLACQYVVHNISFDNNDFQDEAPSSKGTTHCTYGIIIQNRVHTCMSPPAEVTIPSHRKNKSNLTYAPQPLSDYPFAPRVGPDRVPDATTLVTTLVPSSLNEACDQDQAWLLARLCPDLMLPHGIYTQVYFVKHIIQKYKANHVCFS